MPEPSRPRSQSAPPSLGSASLSAESQAMLQQTSASFDAAHLAKQQEQQAELADESRKNQLRAEANAKVALRNAYRKHVRHPGTGTNAQAVARAQVARQELAAREAAAATLQAAVRGRLARLELKKQQAAATTLQAAFRGLQGRKEAEVLKTARDVGIRDTAVTTLLGEITAARTKDAVKRVVYLKMTLDTQIVPMLDAITTEAEVELNAMVANQDWADYPGKLAAIRKEMREKRSILEGRWGCNLVFREQLQDLMTTAKTTTFSALVAKMPNVPSSVELWQTLGDLCSGDSPQDVNAIQDTIRKLVATYVEPRVYTRTATKSPFDRNDSNTWNVNPLRWNANIIRKRAEIEGQPAWDAREEPISDATLTGRTKAKGSLMVVDKVMHEHISGNSGVGFCYRRESDDSVTPWIMDYAASRNGNNYNWELGGRNQPGDPAVSLPAQTF